MKKLILLLVVFFSLCSFSYGQVNPNSTYVNGYYKNNGTYVNGYYRTTPNQTINDNYSTYPNYNPYTGKQGNVQPNYSRSTYSAPRYSNPTYSYPRTTYPTTNYYYRY